MNDSVVIRSETPGDADAIHQVNQLAFERNTEADLVEASRQAGNVILSLVASMGEEIAGHALFTPVELRSESGQSIHGAALGPIAVRPNRQRQGIGSALIREGLTRLAAREIPFCVVLGHAEYYPRFGFKTSTLFGIRAQWEVPDPVFMALELQPGALYDHQGTVYYSKMFAEDSGRG